MFVPNLPMNEGLSARSRLRAGAFPAAQIRFWELAWLIVMGASAATASTFWDWSLGIPGHAILRVVFPMSLGLALVPRRGGGLVMGASALASLGVILLAGRGLPGLGATTSLALTGPMLDTALWRARQGWILYGGFAVAGLVSNLTALAIRGGARLGGIGPARGLGGGGGRGLGGGGGLGAGGGDSWWLYAPLSYAVCGLLAGLICAAIWFANRPRSKQGTSEVGL